MISPIADPRQADEFIFASCSYDPDRGQAELVYRFSNGPQLVERVNFPGAPWPQEESRQSAFRRALELLHLVAGVSYYKAGAAPTMRFESDGLASAVPDFARRLYVEGLAEFGYINGLDMAKMVRFPGGREDSRRVDKLNLPDRALVAMGGGKDSLVGLSLVQDLGIEVQPVCVGDSELIAQTVEATGLPLLRIGRSLAPELARMNKAGALNGHVPVTAINSAILLCAAILYGFRYVVFSNERSADEATLVRDDGVAVNHQFSKSSRFERDLQRLVREQISPDLHYFSILRPLSELGVVKRFAALDKFHDIFSSCNRNFHLDGSRVEGRWCRDCPKCRFAALSLALFVGPEQLIRIQGGNVLDDPGQLNGFRSLCQLGMDKPFECVGEAGECRAALRALTQSPEWDEHFVVKALAPQLQQVHVPELPDVYRARSFERVPDSLKEQLKKLLEDNES